MSGLTDYLNEIVPKLGEILRTFNPSMFPGETINKVKEAIAKVQEFLDEYPSMPLELKNTIIDLKNLLFEYKAIVPSTKKDFITSRINFKNSCLKKFSDSLTESNWTKFKEFSSLQRILR